MTTGQSNRHAPKKKPQPRPGFRFGIFDFSEFADWLIGRHEQCVDWLMQTAATSCDELDADSPLFDAYQGKSLSMAIDGAYLAMLAIALAYSVREDLMDGVDSPGKLIEEGAFRRARYMLKLHARHLPVRLGGKKQGSRPSILDERAIIAGNILMLIYISGFKCPSPNVQLVVKNLPAPVRAQWKKHEHADMNLVQMMAVSFAMAFRPMIGEDNWTRQWRRVLDDFWAGWVSHLLEVEYALHEEDLQANEKLDDEALEEP